MTVESVKAVMKHILKKAGTLAAHDGVAGYRLKVAVGRIGGEDLDLPFAIGIVGVARRINLRGQEVHPVGTGANSMLEVEQRRRGSRGGIRALMRACGAEAEY